MEKLGVLILVLNESNEIVNIILDQRYLKVNEPDFNYGDVLRPSIPIPGYSDPTFRRNFKKMKSRSQNLLHFITRAVIIQCDYNHTCTSRKEDHCGNGS